MFYFSLVFILSTSFIMLDATKKDFILNFNTVHDPNQAIKSILLHCNEENTDCIELFKKAQENKSASAQLFIAHTHAIMTDSKYGFSHLPKKRALETLSNYCIAHETMHNVIDMLKIAPPSHFPQDELIDITYLATHAKQIINQSITEKNIFGLLSYILTQSVQSESCQAPQALFNTASILHSLHYYETFPELDYWIGNKLVKGFPNNSLLFKEGLHHLLKSGFVSICYEDQDPYEAKKIRILKKENKLLSYQIVPNVTLIGCMIIKAKTEAAWLAYKKEHLDTYEPMKDTLFNHYHHDNLTTMYKIHMAFDIQTSYRKKSECAQLKIKSKNCTIALIKVMMNAPYNPETGFPTEKEIKVKAFFDAPKINQLVDYLEHWLQRNPYNDCIPELFKNQKIFDKKWYFDSLMLDKSPISFKHLKKIPRQISF